jgi:cell division topological specificity factor
MTSFFDRLKGQNQKSANLAKERLKLVLIHDRTDMSTEDMERMQSELIQVISKYVEIDPKHISISMTQEGREQRLIADVPVKAAKKHRMQ